MIVQGDVRQFVPQYLQRAAGIGVRAAPLHHDATLLDECQRRRPRKVGAPGPFAEGRGIGRDHDHDA